MSNTPETFCDLMKGVVCPGCPLNLITEEVWREGVKPSATPYDVATDVRRVISGTFSQAQDSFTEEDIENHPGYDFDEAEKIASDEEFVEYVARDALHDLSEITLPMNPQISEAMIEDDGNFPDEFEATVEIGTVAVQCVTRQFNECCTLEEMHTQILDEFDRLVFKGLNQTERRQLGATIVENIARHGSAAEVRALCGPVRDALIAVYDRLYPEYDTGQADFAVFPEESCRLYLMYVAEMLAMLARSQRQT